MTDINKLVAVSTVAPGDLLALWSQSFGAEQSVSITKLAAAISSLITAGKKVTQYAAPGATGLTTTIAVTDTWLILTPLAGYAAHTIALPTGVDRSEVLVNCTQAITTLTISGGTVVGGPTTLAVNGFFLLRFDGVLSIWYRVD